jgi:ribulose kinase
VLVAVDLSGMLSGATLVTDREIRISASQQTLALGSAMFGAVTASSLNK